MLFSPVAPSPSSMPWLVDSAGSGVPLASTHTGSTAKAGIDNAISNASDSAETAGARRKRKVRIVIGKFLCRKAGGMPAMYSLCASRG